MIVISDVSKRISQNFELRVKDVKFEKGCNYKISGKNGSGKTLFLKIIIGLIDKDSGVIKIERNRISGFLGISRMIDYLTPKEYFYLACKSYGIAKKEVLERFNLINSFFNRKYMDERKLICDYSDGNKQLIGIIASCISRCDYILLDEPFNYLDEETLSSLIKMMDFFNREYKTSFIFTDNTNKCDLDCIYLRVENGLIDWF